MTSENWTEEDELNFKMGDMNGEVGERQSLEQKLIDDIVWDATTKLRGWEKHKAFIERVTGEPVEEFDFRLVDIRIRRGIAARLEEGKLKDWFTKTADELEQLYYGDK